MENKDIIKYVMTSPINSNPAVLDSMLNTLVAESKNIGPLFHFKDPSITDLFQWSTGIIIVFDTKWVGEEVHFSNDKQTSLTRAINKMGEVQIPDVLLQKAAPLEVYLFVKDEETGNYTKQRQIQRILARPKPEDYVITEDEIKVWETKLDIYQGVDKAGYVMTVDEAGNLVASPPGQASGENKVYEQTQASNEWIVNHNMNKFPSVTIVDSANNVVIGEVTYNDLNNLTITFSCAFSGKVYLN